MNTWEKKVDVCLRWILADGEERRNEIAAEAASLLRQSTETARFCAVDDCVGNLLRELGTGQAILDKIWQGDKTGKCGRSCASIKVKEK